MTVEEIRQQLKQNTLRVVALTDGLTEIMANLRPEDNGWTIAELIEHLALTDKAIYMAIRSAKITGTGLISPDALIKEFLLDNTVPIRSPELVTPAKNVELAAALFNFNYWRDALFAYISQSMVPFDDAFALHPILGMLSRRQWLLFSLYHADRHLQQILRTKAYLVQHN